MTTMTVQERKAMVDAADYAWLLEKARKEPAGSPWFTGGMGDYLLDEMKRKAALLTTAERVAVSKRVGWAIGGSSEGDE